MQQMRYKKQMRFLNPEGPHGIGVTPRVGAADSIVPRTTRSIIVRKGRATAISGRSPSDRRSGWHASDVRKDARLSNLRTRLWVSASFHRDDTSVSIEDLVPLLHAACRRKRGGLPVSPMSVVSIVLAIGVTLTGWGMFSARSQLAVLKEDKARVQSNYDTASVSAGYFQVINSW